MRNIYGVNVSKRIEDIVKQPFRHGVITNLSRDEYRASCGLNPSSLVAKSPKHIKHAYENPTESSDVQLLGTVTHTLCWEPHKLDDEYAVWTGGRRYGKEWDAFREANQDRTIIKQEQLDEAANIARALTDDPLVKELASEGIAETAVFTEEHGLQCRGLLDWINTKLGILCDLKVCHNIEAHVFGAYFRRFGYDQKMAVYKRWFEREATKVINSVKLICVESKPPYDVAVVPLDQAVLDKGWEKANEKIRQVRESIDTGVWHGVAKGEEYFLSIPAWEMDDDTEVTYA